MKRSHAVRNLIASLALLLTPYALAGRVVRANPAERFRLLEGYVIIVRVTVNGAGPFDFLLDTGTNTTLIDEELAAQLALRPDGRVFLDTVAGTQVVPYARLATLSLAGRTVAGLEALWADLRSVRSIDAKIRGVVGWNFLSESNFLLDYAARRIAFTDEPASAPPDGIRFPIEEDDGKPLVRARFATAGGPSAVRLAVDSAVPRLALFGRAARMLDVGSLGSRWLQVSTVTGRGGARESLLKSLQVGNETFDQLPVLLMMGGAAGGVDRAEDGLLPTRLFRSIYFDRERFVIFNPRVQN